MSLIIGLHEPVEAETTIFVSGERRHGCVCFIDEGGAEVSIYTTPLVAEALAKAFREAMENEAAMARSERRTREMNAELPEETAAVLRLKGMIS